MLNQVCEQFGWEPAQRVLARLKDRFAGCISSQMAEDFFNFVKKKLQGCEREEQVQKAREVLGSRRGQACDQ